MTRRALRLREILRDSAVLLLAGIALGLVANVLSPRGIVLRRDYFAGLTAPGAKDAIRPTAPPTSNRAGSSRGVSGIDAARQARLATRGIGIVDHARAAELFRDVGYAEGRIVFIDARDDAHYEAAHIRGAHQFDHYRLEKFVGEILGVCAVAERIVVYCNGGECEDSELVAGDLLQFGVPAAKLLVYAGGITEWQSHRMPVERGPRGGDQPKTR